MSLLVATMSNRKGLPHASAIEIMNEEAKKGWWDKQILSEFIKMLEKLPAKVPEPSSVA